MKSKIMELRIFDHKRSKNKLGNGSVPCIASDRWLQFPSVSSIYSRDGELILLKVMTKDKNKKDKIICNLVITREDLLEAINSVKSPIK